MVFNLATKSNIDMDDKYWTINVVTCMSKMCNWNKSQVKNNYF
jgi:hypothetical protein